MSILFRNRYCGTTFDITFSLFFLFPQEALPFDVVSSVTDLHVTDLPAAKIRSFSINGLKVNGYTAIESSVRFYGEMWIVDYL